MKLKNLTVGVGLVLTASLQATQVQVGFNGSSYGQYQTGQGGEFTLKVINPSTGLDLGGYSSDTRDLGVFPSFQTFCIEDNEYIYPYASIYDVTATSSAVNGGVSGGNPDPVSKGTGWIYSLFARGDLSSYGYEYATDTAAHQQARHDSAAALQNTIWWLEGELGADAPMPVNAFSTAVVDHFGSEADAKADGAEVYGVYALNLKNKDGVPGDGQDQLYYHVPDVTNTFSLLASSLGFLAFCSRRRK